MNLVQRPTANRSNRGTANYPPRKGYHSTFKHRIDKGAAVTSGTNAMKIFLNTSIPSSTS